MVKLMLVATFTVSIIFTAIAVVVVGFRSLFLVPCDRRRI
jgi:hypothetical protein